MTVIAIVIWGIILRMMTRPVIVMTSFKRRKYVLRPSYDKLRLVGMVETAALFVAFAGTGAAYFIDTAPANILEGILWMLPAIVTAAVLFVLFERMTMTAGTTVKRLIRKNEDRLRAEYLRNKEWKDSGKEVFPTDYIIGKKTYRI